MPGRFAWRKLKTFVVRRILALDDTPHRIALGVALGMFVTWTPTIGLQMIILLALAALFRANKFVGLPLVWISNPVTIVPIYGPSYLLGMWLMGGHYRWGHFTKAVREGMRFQGGWLESVAAWWHAFESIFFPLWLGSLIVATAVGAMSYLLTYWGVVRFRRFLHRHEHIHIDKRHVEFNTKALAVETRRRAALPDGDPASVPEQAALDLPPIPSDLPAFRTPPHKADAVAQRRRR